MVEDRRCLLVKYEDLIDNPNLTLETTSDFADLRISPETAMSSFSKSYGDAVRPGEARLKGMLADGVLRDRRHVWRQRMSLEEASIVGEIAGSHMRGFGYSI